MHRYFRSRLRGTGQCDNPKGPQDLDIRRSVGTYVEYPEEPADENQQRILANDRLVDLYAALLLDARQPLHRAVVSLWEAHVEEIKRRIARDRSGRRKFSDVETPGKKLSNEKKKVLLIENDEDVAWDYKIVMENVDFEVWWTDQALRTAATFTDFDAVVMDIRMPPGKAFSWDQTVLGRRTGVELAKELIMSYLTLSL